jgi:hypothetical protein
MEHGRRSEIIEGEHRQVTLVGDVNQRRCCLGLLTRLGDHHRHVLAVMQDGAALKMAVVVAGRSA